MSSSRGHGSATTAPTDARNSQPSSDTAPVLEAAYPFTNDPFTTTADGSINTKWGASTPNFGEMVSDKSHLRLSAIIAITLRFGLFMGAADLIVVATLAGPISSGFNSLYLFSWLATAYLVASFAIQSLSSRGIHALGPGFGLVLSNSLLAAGNLICGLSGNETTLIVGRAVAGMGGGALMGTIAFLESKVARPSQQGLGSRVTHAWSCGGAIFGAIFGGCLYDHSNLGWRLVFLIQVPFALFSALLLIPGLTKPSKQPDQPALKKTDLGGVLLAVLSLSLFVFGLSSSGSVVPWKSPIPSVAVVLSILFLGILFWWERNASEPIFPSHLVLNATILPCCIVNMFCAMVFFVVLFYVPLRFQVLGDSATTAGIKMLPCTIGLLIGSLASAYTMKTRRNYMGMLTGSLLALASGICILATLDQESSVWLTGGALLVIGSCYSAVSTITQTACWAAVEDLPLADVASITYFSKYLGATTGMAIVSMLYQGILDFGLWIHLGNTPGAAEEIYRIRKQIHGFGQLGNGFMDGALVSFTEAFQAVWLLLLLWTVFALAAAVPVKHPRD